VVETNRYLYQDWLVLAVTDVAGDVLETYTHGADLSGHVGGAAGGIGGILASTQTGGAAYYHYNFNGNVVNVSSSNQTQLAKYTYGPFGEVLLKEGEFDSRYQFSTKEYDSQTGLNYYGYRFYSPELGRWLNRDPIGEAGGLSLFAYVGNAPTIDVDFLGLAGLIDILDPPDPPHPGPNPPGWNPGNPGNIPSPPGTPVLPPSRSIPGYYPGPPASGCRPIGSGLGAVANVPVGTKDVHVKTESCTRYDGCPGTRDVYTPFICKQYGRVWPWLGRFMGGSPGWVRDGPVTKSLCI
jgi:RHS repeat-associated protein